MHNFILCRCTWPSALQVPEMLWAIHLCYFFPNSPLFAEVPPVSNWDHLACNRGFLEVFKFFLTINLQTNKFNYINGLLASPRVPKSQIQPLELIWFTSVPHSRNTTRHFDHYLIKIRKHNYYQNLNHPHPSPKTERNHAKVPRRPAQYFAKSQPRVEMLSKNNS